MGCIARLGCLILLACLAAVAWLTRDRWMPEVGLTPHRIAGHGTGGTAGATGATEPVWQPLSDSGVARTQAALTRLSKSGGPVFATLSGSDVASYIFKTAAHRLPPSTDSLEAEVVGEQVRLRATIRLADIGGASQLGALGGILGDHERIEMDGTFIVDKPGLMEYRVEALTVQNIHLPKAMIPGILSKMIRGDRPAGVSDTGIPMEIPRFIGDVRVANGKVTLYKTTE